MAVGRHRPVFIASNPIEWETRLQSLNSTFKASRRCECTQRQNNTMILGLVLTLLLVNYVHSSPISPRQAVTAMIAPSQPPPAGCIGSFPTLFGVAVMNVSMPASTAISPQKRQISTPAPIFTMGTVNQINDGQVQGGMHTDFITMRNATPTDPPTSTMAPVTQMSDGQLQVPTATTVPAALDNAAESACKTTGPASMAPSPKLNNGNNTGRPPSALRQVCSYSSQEIYPPETSAATQAPPLLPPEAAPFSFNVSPTAETTSSIKGSVSTPTTTSSSATQFNTDLSLVSCLTNSTLRLHLINNSVYDAQNRTGYIASNFQFQFDGPPQHGAMYTCGWSICPVNSDDSSLSTAPSNGGDGGEDTGNDGEVVGRIRTLALGNQTTFWQCLSGSFYNLYTVNWAAQCSPVELRIVRFEVC
jgi:hypothetical protein